VEFPAQSTICTALTRLSRLLPIKYAPRAMLFTSDHSPKRNPGQEKKLRPGCFGSNHGFSPLKLFVSSQKDRRKELV
jgi:hypothetical protein